MSAVTTLKKDEQEFGKDEAGGRGKAKHEDASDDEDGEAEFLARMRNDRGDPAVKMLHKLGFGDGDEEPSEVA